MKPLTYLGLAICFVSCEHLDDFIGDNDGGGDDDAPKEMVNIDFKYHSTIQVGGEGSAEISGFDSETKRLFVINAETVSVSVYDLNNLGAPVFLKNLVQDHAGNPNSVSISNGIVAVAYEAQDKQAPGFVKFFDAESLEFISGYTIGSLPDMVTFTPDGKYAVVANEGEPNDDYTIDPKGMVSIINVESGEVINLDFESFNAQEEILEDNGFRVFGPGATLAMDVEPEYVAVSDDSKRAWVTLQEKNVLQ